jgi:hypothetical protein
MLAARACCVAVEVDQNVDAVLSYELCAFAVRLVSRQICEVLHVFLQAPATCECHACE